MPTQQETTRAPAHDDRTTFPGEPVHTGRMDTALRQFWARLGPMPEDLRLIGGAALALYLGHRAPAGLDFATPSGRVDPHVAAAIPGLGSPDGITGGAGMVSLTPQAGREIVVTLMECGPHVPAPAHAPRAAPNGVAVSAPADLVAAKLVAARQRDDVSDAADLAAAEERWPGILEQGLEIAMAHTALSRSALITSLADPPTTTAAGLDATQIAALQRHAKRLGPPKAEIAKDETASTVAAIVAAPGSPAGYDPRPDARDWRGTPIPPVSDPLPAIGRLPEIAERMWWNGPAWTILRNSAEFLCHAIDHAREPDLAYLWKVIGPERWRRALQRATPGTMSRSRYRLWCLWLSIDEQVPANQWQWNGHLNDGRLDDSRARAYRRHAHHAARRRLLEGEGKGRAKGATENREGSR